MIGTSSVYVCYATWVYTLTCVPALRNLVDAIVDCSRYVCTTKLAPVKELTLTDPECNKP
jgi:hypothetical protein